MSVKKKKPKPHPCFAKVDALLEKQGDCLQRTLTISNGDDVRAVYVVTERKNSLKWKRGSTWLRASYCPFCGKKLDE